MIASFHQSCDNTHQSVVINARSPRYDRLLRTRDNLIRALWRWATKMRCRWLIIGWIRRDVCDCVVCKNRIFIVPLLRRVRLIGSPSLRIIPSRSHHRQESEKLFKYRWCFWDDMWFLCGPRKENGTGFSRSKATRSQLLNGKGIDARRYDVHRYQEICSDQFKHANWGDSTRNISDKMCNTNRIRIIVRLKCMCLWSTMKLR